MNKEKCAIKLYRSPLPSPLPLPLDTRNSPATLVDSRVEDKSRNRSSSAGAPNDQPEDEGAEGVYQRCLCGAQFLQMAQELYHTASHFNLKRQIHLSIPAASNSIQNQVVSLLMALSLRLDADSALRDMQHQQQSIASEGSSLGYVPTQHPARHKAYGPSPTSLSTGLEGYVSANISELRGMEERIEGLLRELMGLGVDASKLQQVFLVLSLATQCRTSAPDVDTFVEKRQQQFISLSAPELLRCADIAMNEGSRCVSVSRSMLQLGIQVLMRSSHPDYSLIGNLYRRLIYLSPSRMQVGGSVDAWIGSSSSHSLCYASDNTSLYVLSSSSRRVCGWLYGVVCGRL